MDEFISEHSKHIHGDHLALVEGKYMATMMYGNIKGYQYKGWLNFPLIIKFFLTFDFSDSDLPEKFLQRKIDLCRNVLEVYDKIDPGESNQRANVIFELNCATIMQYKAKLSRNLIKKDDALVWSKTLTNSLKIINAFQPTQCMNTIKSCYDVLIKETENRRIMDVRLERILNESVEWKVLSKGNANFVNSKFN